MDRLISSKKFQIFLIAFHLAFLSGCATKTPLVPPAPALLADASVEPEAAEAPAPLESSQALQNINGDVLEAYSSSHGVIFAKTDFQGVLKTVFVRLVFESLDDPAHTFQLHVGDSSQTSFPWSGSVVETGYFFIELPAGRYKVSSLSIPVGSTLATEDVDISLEVFAHSVTYIGTLKAIGTKEKIKLGGLPVIKPGFEYVLEVIDEQGEAMATFQQRFPQYKDPVKVQLMEVRRETNTKESAAHSSAQPAEPQAESSPSEVQP